MLKVEYCRLNDEETFWYFLLFFWRTITIHKSGRSFSEAVSRFFPKTRTVKNNWCRSSRFVVSLINKWADGGQSKLIAFSLESKILRGSKSVYSSTTRSFEATNSNAISSACSVFICSENVCSKMSWRLVVQFLHVL